MGRLEPGDLLQRPFHLLGGEGRNQKIAGALTQAAQYQFGIVAWQNHDDGQLGIQAQQVGNQGQAWYRVVRRSRAGKDWGFLN